MASIYIKFLSIIFTLLGAVFFLVFGYLLLIFLFELDLGNDYLSFELPTISKNNFFQIENTRIYKVFSSKFEQDIYVISKILFNSVILCLFWIQHIIMSNKNFKKFLEKFCDYHAVERGLYTTGKNINDF